MPKPIGHVPHNTKTSPTLGQRKSNALMSSLGGSRAKTYRSRIATALVLKAHVLACGGSSSVSLGKLNLGLFSWRTFQQSLFEGELQLLQRLPTWGITADGVLSALPTPVHLTPVPDGGVWPTPVATDSTNRLPPKNPVFLSTGLVRQQNTEYQSQVRLGQAVKLFGDTQAFLNPDWVEALMGYPPSWTDLSSPAGRTLRLIRGNHPDKWYLVRQIGRTVFTP
jgi:hypothetical protein